MRKVWVKMCASFILFGLLSCNRSAMDQRVDFTIDMSTPDNSPLQNLGGYVYHNDIIIIHDAFGNFYALSKYCTLDLSILNYIASPSYLQCPVDQTEFATNGSVLNARNGAAGLTTYLTAQNGNYLRIYSRI